MRPTLQRRNTNGGGDCFEACVASLLEIPIGQVPDWHATLEEAEPGWCALTNLRIAAGEDPPGYPDEVWYAFFDRRAAWCRSLGLSIIELNLRPGRDDGPITVEEWKQFVAYNGPGFYWIATTRVHPKFCHATVWCDWRPVWNPTAGHGLDPDVLGPVEAVSYFVVNDVAKLGILRALAVA